MTWDIEIFRSMNCYTCANKVCDQSDKQVDACISDTMIREADERFMAGEE